MKGVDYGWDEVDNKYKVKGDRCPEKRNSKHRTHLGKYGRSRVVVLPQDEKEEEEEEEFSEKKMRECAGTRGVRTTRTRVGFTKGFKLSFWV